MRFFSLSISSLFLILAVACSQDSFYSNEKAGLDDETILKNTKLPAFGAYLSPNSNWDGVSFFKKAICSADGGNATSPNIIVENIPYGTNAVLVEFNNLSKKGLDKDGGLGTIGYYIPEDSSNFELLPIRGESTALPSYAFIEKSHRIKNKKPAGYLPPCKYWAGDEIGATIKAIKRTGAYPEEETQILATTKLYFGVVR